MSFTAEGREAKGEWLDEVVAKATKVCFRVVNAGDILVSETSAIPNHLLALSKCMNIAAGWLRSAEFGVAASVASLQPFPFDERRHWSTEEDPLAPHFLSSRQRDSAVDGVLHPWQKADPNRGFSGISILACQIQIKKLVIEALVGPCDGLTCTSRRPVFLKTVNHLLYASLVLG